MISTYELSSNTDLSKGQAILGIRKLDKDHDGKLNREEFINLLDSVAPSNHEIRFRKMFIWSYSIVTK